MAVAVGTLIGTRYEVLSYLGSGTYGDVYRVHDKHLDEVVALKLLAPLGGGPWLEGQILTQLDSPYILGVKNADVDAGVPFLVTVLAEHGSADGPMKPVGVPPDRAVRWVRHACRGAHRAHDAQLVHRDIKPANLFLTASGEAQLGDFGIAALMDANGRAPGHGTPVIRAPEAALGGGVTTVRSDVFSLGATLYALLAGEYASELGDPPLRDVAPHVSQALAQRVQKAMAQDAANRYATAAEFDAALGELPAVDRRWRQTDEHNGHEACFRGEAPGKMDATVCLVSAGTRWEVVAVHQPSGRRINAACRPPGPESAVPRHLRTAIAAVP